ncbi:unnamed protein product [Macrosiphum euphorbiae]|uniref:Uncharacterized protein n=1 Tax=Macrosiphum euphorbiae TaxID=13131 RepID=A0AAV0WAV1_9HEMI|nr:unnamed protein product [Macrosiphum euphorbiae]
MSNTSNDIIHQSPFHQFQLQSGYLLKFHRADVNLRSPDKNPINNDLCTYLHGSIVLLFFCLAVYQNTIHIEAT